MLSGGVRTGLACVGKWIDSTPWRHQCGDKTRRRKHNDPISDSVGAGANTQSSSFHSAKSRFRGETAALPSCRDTPDRAACSDAQTQHLSSFCHKCLTFFKKKIILFFFAPLFSPFHSEAVNSSAADTNHPSDAAVTDAAGRAR